MEQEIKIEEPLFIITEDGTEPEEYPEPIIAASNPEPVTVTCPLCGEVIEIPLYDSMDRTDALIAHIRKEHARSQMAMGDSNFHSLMLHAVADMYGPGGIIIDEAKARSSPCHCVTYDKEKKLCFSPGIVGGLTDEQEKVYCPTTEEVEAPGLRKRLVDWQGSVKVCKTEMPPTDGIIRLETYLKCMSRELSRRGEE